MQCVNHNFIYQNGHKIFFRIHTTKLEHLKMKAKVQSFCVSLNYKVFYYIESKYVYLNSFESIYVFVVS